MIESFTHTLTYLPAITQENYFLYVMNIFIILSVLRVLIMIGRLILNKQLGFSSKPYNSTTPQEKKILILGDSTAVGTGASAPEDTIAGRLAHDFPHSQIVNLAENGGLISDLTHQIAKVKNEHFDMIIISAGGNDVWHGTWTRTVERHLENVLLEATRISDHKVIFLVYNNIALAPIWPLLIQLFLRWRSKKVYGTIYQTTHKAKVPTIDLFTTTTDNPFLKNSRGLFARDGIHPNSRGYALWYLRMWNEMVKNGFRY